MSLNSEQISAVFQSRHEVLVEKNDVWELIYNSYMGGTDYYNKGYLYRYPKEGTSSFAQRKKRSAYFNQVSPIVDMMSGLLFLNEPTRKIPSSMEFFEENVSRKRRINEFMRIVSAYSLMFTCGVLIDSPEFDPETVKTEKQRRDRNLNPYAVLYLPFQIRDFYMNNDGELEWVLLDNSYIEHSDPFTAASKVTEYRLWTKEFFQDFTQNSEENTINEGEVISHGLGAVPFRFASWRDDNCDFIGESIFEDIAMISRLIYNSMSYMDEMLASGTFKVLMYPTLTGELPPNMVEGGLGALSAIPYDGSLTGKPFYDGATLGDIEPFIKAMEFYMAEILKKIGANTDETKEFVKSGAAKKVDFQKMRALLVSGALAMSKLEKWMFETAALWLNKTEVVEIEYTSAFASEDLRTEVTMLSELLIHPVKALRKNVLDLLVKKLLSNDLNSDKLQEIYADIEKNISANPAESGIRTGALTDPKAAAAKIKTAKQKTEQV